MTALAPVSQLDPTSLIRPRRKITGMSAILLPFLESGAIDWNGFKAHLERTFKAELVPAVNMDTGYANLIDEDVRVQALENARSIAAGRPFVAGVFVGDREGEPVDLPRYQSGIEQVVAYGGTPILFQSFGLTTGEDDDIYERYLQITKDCDEFLAFELGQMFAAFGKIYSLDLYGRLMSIPRCIGAKHSSLSRELEWQRLVLRDRQRPDFRVLTGNDLAIDMVIYGSDYLLGLSTFAPEAFARRDELWHSGHPDFYQLNDLLQYLGAFAFRAPVPAYKHSAAMFLNLRGQLATSKTHPASPTRPETDIEVLEKIAASLDSSLGEASP